MYIYICVCIHVCDYLLNVKTMSLLLKYWLYNVKLPVPEGMVKPCTQRPMQRWQRRRQCNNYILCNFFNVLALWHIIASKGNIPISTSIIRRYREIHAYCHVYGTILKYFCLILRLPFSTNGILPEYLSAAVTVTITACHVTFMGICAILIGTKSSRPRFHFRYRCGLS